MQPEFEKASDVSEYLLNRTGVALMQGDFESFAPCFILPQHIETFEGRCYVTDRETLHQIFRAVRENYRQRGVTRVVRHCVQAEFKSKNRVEALHEARVYRGDDLLQPPYRTFSWLERREEEGWKVAYSLYAITQAEDHINALLSATAPKRGPSPSH
ncbi:hypothetical protein BOO69_12805 [Sulfitobacter alexandrii]|uniref:SnoaL-like domain-containing protein n=1 Tax=Sulfitobacter alexandrii TaxID=1917485 RepID=A0A1J0WIP6_9RHOB|nr:hypothetical protein [Sulfitobacter alexandrii]APE44179.1 hypothetical protein BOO69_12805 [Sulfitobacter alexandrii]